jgi:hypothetical protein
LPRRKKASGGSLNLKINLRAANGERKTFAVRAKKKDAPVHITNRALGGFTNFDFLTRLHGAAHEFSGATSAPAG